MDNYIFLNGKPITYTENTNFFDISNGFAGGFGGSNLRINIIEIDSSNKIYVGGGFTSYNGVQQNKLIRLNADGTKDITFDISNGFGTSNGVEIHDIKIDSSNNKIYVGGDFTTFRDVSQNYLVRLNYDGTKDISFDISSGFNAGIYSMCIDSSAKLYASGGFTTYKSQSQNYLIKLNYDGTKDTSFDISTGFGFAVNHICLDSSNKLYAGGFFSTYRGLSQNRLIRLNSNGTKDATFNIGTGFDSWVHEIIINSNNKIYVGGDFTTYKGLSQNKLIRLNYDGTKDTSFDISTGFDSVVETVIESNNKIYVGGWFTSYKGLLQNRIIRLTYDGSKDTAFNIGTGFNDINRSIKLNNNKLYCGGYFSTFKGLPAPLFIRLDEYGNKNTYDITTKYLVKNINFIFTINTANSGSASDTFILPTTGSGYNFTVEWGDNTSDSYNGTPGNITHVYSTPGIKQINISGIFPRIYFNNAGDRMKIISIEQWGENNFSTMQNAFKGCGNLISLPLDPIKGPIYNDAFRECFRLCISLTRIPPSIFARCVNVTSDAFNSTFVGCNITSIPADLFKYNINLSTSAFYGTFSSCSLLTSIPTDLFRYNTLVDRFAFFITFANCTSLTTIPPYLFRYNRIVSAGGFVSTFQNCDKLQLNRNIFYADGEQSTRFSDVQSSINFDNCFDRVSFTGIQGEAPDLWNCDFGINTVIKTDCFNGAGNSVTSLSNYNSIPIDWK
jgi:uncharacterized delta-60 repeat protein